MGNGGIRVSVVIPCFNSGEFLHEAVDSALAQTYSDLDVVLVDDGSDEPGTLAALAEAATNPRVRLIRTQNHVPAAARNAWIHATDADFIMPLDADDVIEPSYVAEAVGVLRTRGDVGAVYCHADFIRGKAGPWGLLEFSRKTILVHNAIFCTMLYRRCDWESVGGYDSLFIDGREDNDFVLNILSLGLAPYRLDGCYFHYRRPISGISVNHAFGKNREALIVTSARLWKNHPDLYAEHAEDLFTFTFGLQDRINDLQNRYAFFEKMRRRFPGVVSRLRSARRAVRRATHAARHAGAAG